MKRILSSILVLAVVLSGTVAFANIEKDVENMVPIPAEEVTDKKISSEAMEFDLEALNAYYKDDTLMVPLREIAEKLGGAVTWNNEKRSAEITGLTPWTEVIIGENRYFFGKIAPFELSQAPDLKEGLTYVPVEFFSEVLKLVYTVEDNVLRIGEEAPKLEKVILNAFIKDIDEERNRVLILGDGTSEHSSYAWLTQYENSEIVNEKGEEIPFEDLKVGNRVVVTMPHILALSYPAQGSLEKIVLLEGKSFQIESEEIKNEENNSIIRHPVLKGMDEELTEEELNNKIEEFVGSIGENNLYKDLELQYEITLIDDNKISFLFRGTFVPEGFEEEKHLVKSLNLDLQTAEEIDFENYFKQDEVSQEELNKKLEKAAREYGLEGFEAEGVSIYFWDKSVMVYYWPLDDSAERPVELYIPVTEIENIINDGF